MQTTFSHSSPGRIYYGPGSIQAMAAAMPGDRRYLLVADEGVAGAGIAANVYEIFCAAGLDLVLFSEVRPDPGIQLVEAALAFYRDNGATAIIGLGGGSAIDTAKGLAAIAGAGPGLRAYGDGLEVTGPLPPLYAIPTTAGTGSEATRVAVITDEAKVEKMAIRGECLLPLAMALDPNLLQTLPAQIAAETGADALTHAIEALVSNRATPLTDQIALGAIEIIGANLRSLVHDRSAGEAALAMLLASNLAGQAFTNAGLGLVHSMAEPFGARFHFSHGLSCAIYLPVVMDFNQPAAAAKFELVQQALGQGGAGGPADSPAATVRELFREIQLPATFSEVGLEFTLDPWMTKQVWPQFSTSCNPRQPGKKELDDLFQAPCRP